MWGSFRIGSGSELILKRLGLVEGALVRIGMMWRTLKDAYSTLMLTVEHDAYRLTPSFLLVVLDDREDQSTNLTLLIGV